MTALEIKAAVRCPARREENDMRDVGRCVLWVPIFRKRRKNAQGLQQTTLSKPLWRCARSSKAAAWEALHDAVVDPNDWSPTENADLRRQGWQLVQATATLSLLPETSIA